MKKTMRKGMTLLAAAAMLISTLGNLSFPAKAASLIENGDFSNGTAGFVIEKGGYTGAIAETVDAGSGKILSIETGSVAGALHTFRVYQAVSVEKNTDYIWTLELGASVQNCHYLGVVAGDTVNAGGNTALPAEWQTVSGSMTFTANDIGAGAQLNAAGNAADANWLRFDSASGWNHVKITFNSGDNTSVCLAYGVRHTGRAVKTGNWALTKKPAVGKIVNGDFNSGTEGFSGTAATIEVIAEPGNTSNNVLHAIGGGYVRQEVPVKANTDYIFTFRTKKADTNGAIYANVFASDLSTNLASAIENAEVPNNDNFAAIHPTNGAQFNSAGTNWNNIKISFNSGDNTTVYINFNLWTSNRDRYFDDLVLYEKPEIGKVMNGGFEDGLLYFTVSNKLNAEVSAGESHDGEYSLKLSGKDDGSAYGKTVYQEVTVKPNTDYIWSFWYKSTANRTSIVGVTTADDSKLLPSFIKTDAFLVESDRSFTETRDASNFNLWHETLYDTYWSKYSVIFNSGDNSSVRLKIDLITSARGGFTDDWTLDEYTFMQGDANNDGTVDSGDLAELRRRLLGMPSFYMGGIDVNGDGAFNIADFVRLKKNLTDLSPIAGYSLVWADDFGGLSFDKDKWTRAQHMSGQDDLELRYDDTGAAVKDGSAILYAGRTGENSYYANASLTTSNSSGSSHLMSFKYGYVEMRAKIPLGAPAFPSFWMKSLNNGGVHGEIDIFEHFCYSGDKWIQSGVHKWYESGEHLLLTSVGDKAAIGGTNLSYGGWHTYGLLWTPEKLEFICDGVTYHTIDITADGNYEVYNTSTKELTGNRTENGDVFHDYYYLIMNNYLHTPAGTNGADYAANSSTELPLEYEIDYVRLYQNGDGDIRIGALA